MIEFSCKNCGKQFKVPDAFAGKKSKCSKCGKPITIPTASEELIRFRCLSCNQLIGISKKFAGKNVRCAVCKNVMQVPEVSEELQRLGGEVKKSIPKSEQIELALEEGPLKLRPVSEEAPLRPTTPVTEFDKLTSDAHEKPPRKKPSAVLIAAICIIGLLVVGGAAWYFFSGLRDVAKSAGSEAPPDVQKFAEQYITLLAHGDIDKAAELASPKLADANLKDGLEKVARQIGKNKIKNLNCVYAFATKDSNENHFLLMYGLQSERGPQFVLMSILQSNEKLMVDAIAAQDFAGKRVSVGPISDKELSNIVSASAVKNFGGMFGRFIGGFVILFFVVSAVQVISMWVIFNKAGQHGWAAIVPFYNMWVLAEVGDKPGWLGLVMCFCPLIPLVGGIAQFVLWIVISIGVARAGGRGIGFGIGLILLPFIFYPILAVIYD